MDNTLKKDNSISSAIGFALLVFIIKTILFLSGSEMSQWQPYFVFAHLFLIIVCIVFAIRKYIPGESFVDNLKKAVRAGGVYALVTALLVFVYYQFIDVHYFPEMQEKLLRDEILANPEVDTEKAREGINQFFSIFNYTTITLVGFLVAAIAYSLLAAGLKRLMMRKRK